jgi:DNA replication protein DnaC
MTDTASCPLCGGTGWKIVERAGLSGAERCSCSEATLAHARKESAGIPPNYEHASLENFNIEHDNPGATGLRAAYVKVKRFVKDFPAADHPGLLLIGETGAGKTHLAVAAMKQLLQRGHECIFFDYQNLLDRIRAGYDAASGAADREAYRTALEAEVLLLDDLGSHRTTEWVEDTVTSIITYRCNNRKPLIATTNLPDHDLVGKDKDYARKSLGEVIGQRARSRLHEMCRIVDLSGTADYRMKPVR